MDCRELVALRQHHPAWRLLRADHAPLIVSFLEPDFVMPQRRKFDKHALVSRLDDQLCSVRQQPGEEAFPRGAAAYLDDWADKADGWLHKYYPSGSDQAHFEMIVATEKRIEQLASLGKRQLVGIESSLLTIFDLLCQVVERSESEPNRHRINCQRSREKNSCE